MAQLHEIVDRTTELVALPEAYVQLRDKLADPDFCLDDVSTIVSRDPAITANLLRLANSAFFGLSARVTSVPRAVTLLGPRQLHDLLLATAVCTCFDSLEQGAFDRLRFWRRSVLCAVVTRLLARRCAVLDAEAAYVRGLLHDIGHLVMWTRMPAETARAAGIAVERGVPVSNVQRELFGFDYAGVGGLLLQRWHMPRELVEVVRHHVEPGAAGACVIDAAVVHIAARVADALVDGDDTAAAESVSETVWSLAGADPGWLPGICVQALPLAVDGMNALFGGERRSA